MVEHRSRRPVLSPLCNSVDLHNDFTVILLAFSAWTLLVGHPACKKTERWGAGVVICLELCAVLHMSQLMPLPLTVSCSSKIQIDFTFLAPAHPGSPGQRAIKRVCVCVRACVYSFVRLCINLHPCFLQLACELAMDFVFFALVAYKQ